MNCPPFKWTRFGPSYPIQARALGGIQTIAGTLWLPVFTRCPYQSQVLIKKLLFDKIYVGLNALFTASTDNTNCIATWTIDKHTITDYLKAHLGHFNYLRHSYTRLTVHPTCRDNANYSLATTFVPSDSSFTGKMGWASIVSLGGQCRWDTDKPYGIRKSIRFRIKAGTPAKGNLWIPLFNTIPDPLNADCLGTLLIAHGGPARDVSSVFTDYAPFTNLSRYQTSLGIHYAEAYIQTK